ncbi:ankyrin repeat-containing domain protein [Lentinula raphanica]|nr:ankyrin repeat-containing domain protein [Lentinula raphanica]
MSRPTETSSYNKQHTEDNSAPKYDQFENKGREDVHSSIKEEHLREWLAAPDCSIDLNTALSKRVDGTGQWILKMPPYLKWRKEGGILWIQGKAGSGKTILMTSNIDNLKKSSNSSLVAYHYFDIRDNTGVKTGYQGLLCSLLRQFGLQDHITHPVLKNLHAFSQHGLSQSKPTTHELLDSLMKIIKDLVQKGCQVYILIDALNECREVELVLKLLEEMGNVSSIGVIVSSRDYPQEDLNCFTTSLDNFNLLNEDISIFIDSQIQTIFQGIMLRAEVKKVLMMQSEKGIRYIECQLEFFRDFTGLKTVKKDLANLPLSLKETYIRTIKRCQEDKHPEDVHYLLLWLLFSYEPLHISQVATIFAIDLEHSMVEPDIELLVGLDSHVDPTLVTVNNANIVQLAHASVQEFLLEKHNDVQISTLFDINAQLAHNIIAQMCLTYLIQQEKIYDMGSYTLSHGRKDSILFDQYATQYWTEHVQYNEKANTLSKDTVKLIEAFLQKNSKHFMYWRKKYIYIGKRIPSGSHIFRDCTPLQIVSFFGFKGMTQRLLTGNVKIGANTNHVGVEIGTAIQAAASGGFREIVQLLLEHEADVNVQGGFFGTALQAAAFGDYMEIVQLLLKYNANINAKGGHYGTALQAAASQGSSKTIQLLLEFNADVNAQGGYFGTALQAAAYQGHKDVVQILLNHQADINFQGGYHGTALQAAAFGGHKGTVQLLLKYNADINSQGGHYGTALEAAAFGGHKSIIELLLKQNVKVNAKGGYYGTALQAAVVGGHKNIVELLLKSNAGVNIAGGYFGTALQAAAFFGYREIIELLIRYKADINIQKGQYGTALQAAAFEGHQDIIVLLLKHGADVNVQGGCYGTALRAAVFRDHKEIVEFFLEHGADISNYK